MTNQAYHAIRAAKHLSQWGKWATMRYLHNHGVPIGAYRLARQLEATKHIS